MASQLRASTSSPQRNSTSDSRLPNRLFVDATYTLTSGRRSGIERVVNSLRSGCGKLASGLGITSGTLMSLGESFYAISASDEQRIEQVIGCQRDIVSSLPAAYRQTVAPILQLTRSKKLKSWMLPEPGHMGLFKLPYRYWYRRQLQNISQQCQRVELGAGDLLVLPDAYWARKEIWPAVQQARAQGCFVVSVVHDVIPLTHPQFVGERRTRRFADYLRNLAISSDHILCISQTVRQELERTLPELLSSMNSSSMNSGDSQSLDTNSGDLNYCRSYGVFPLGAEFAETQGPVRREVQELFSHSSADNPYVTVAALDPRKNHRYLLDAFERLWMRDPHRKLCLIGRVGSRCEDIVERIALYQRQGRPLFAFHDLSDAELQFCYRHCRGVIFPSIVEGFGLPIVEALWHGQPTLVSDTPIHREVGGQHCGYFDLADPESLVDLLLQSANASNSGQSSIDGRSIDRGQLRPRSWNESSQIFLDQCLAAFSQSLSHAHGLAQTEDRQVA